MRPPARSRRVLMTVDSVGGVWRYAMDLGRSLAAHDTDVVFAHFGPQPSSFQIAEAEAVGRLVQTGAPLDWLVRSPDDLAEVPEVLRRLVTETGADLLHLNLPSQAAGLQLDIPVVAVAHSCVVTWFRAVRGTTVPTGWQWQHRLNGEGLRTADIVLAPSRSFADMLLKSYDGIADLRVVHNGARQIRSASVKQPFILAAGRWWDEGKNGATLDAAARYAPWPVRMAGAQSGPDGQHQPIQHAEASGELPHDQLCQLIGAAGIFCSPSIYEPFGLAPLEAAIAGAALALSDIPTYRELWDGAALFFNARNPESLGRTLQLLAANADLRRHLGARAAERAAGFTLEAQAGRVSAAYGDALQLHARARERA